MFLVLSVTTVSSSGVVNAATEASLMLRGVVWWCRLVGTLDDVMVMRKLPSDFLLT